MARPQEKARAMLNKWVAMREGQQVSISKKPRRPHLASDCEFLADAERFRNQLVREIKKHIANINNPSLPEHEIRELNDRINKKQRQKYHWNKRVFELGGLDYNAIERKRRIEQGDVQLNAQYRYYGQAKNLPGVQEQLEKLKQPKAKRKDLYKNITPDYFGWRDEEDGVLLEVEQSVSLNLEENVVLDDVDYLADVPNQETIQQILLEQKKRAIMEKYSL